MNTGSPGPNPTRPVQPGDQERLVYVVPQDAYGSDDEISLLELWSILWDGKWIGIAITLLCAVTAAIVSLNMTEWYRAEVLLAPAEERRSGEPRSALGNLGGLASLAGISVGGGGNIEALAVLRSRGFLREFIEDLELMPVPITDRKGASLTVAEPLGMLEAGWKKTRYFSYPLHRASRLRTK